MDFVLFNPGKDDKLRNEQDFERFLTKTSLLFFSHGYPIFEMNLDAEGAPESIKTDEFGFDFITTADVNDNYLWKYCLKNYADRFNMQEKSLLQSFTRCVNGYFKVLGIIDKNPQDDFITPGYPIIEVEDIFTEKHYCLTDRKLCQGLVKHDIVSGSLVLYNADIENAAQQQNSSLYVMECSPSLLFPPSDESLVKEMVKEYCSVYKKQYKSLFDKKTDYSKILKDFPVIIFLVALHYYYHKISMPLPKIVNKDKEELVISTSIFKVAGREELKSKLLKIKDIRIADETKKHAVFHWYNKNNIILGTLILKEKTLGFDTNSLERLERFKKIIRELPLEFEKTDYTSAQDILAQSSKNKIKTAQQKKS